MRRPSVLALMVVLSGCQAAAERGAGAEPASRSAPDPTAVLDADGSAIIVHANPDDLRSDPAGNSGGRLACGAIVRVTGG